MKGLTDWRKKQKRRWKWGHKGGNKRQVEIKVGTKRGGRMCRDNKPETIRSEDRNGKWERKRRGKRKRNRV